VRSIAPKICLKNKNLNCSFWPNFIVVMLNRNFNDHIKAKKHTYLSRFIPEEVAEASQIFHVTPSFYQNYFAMRNTADLKGGKPITVLLHSINPLVAFYAIDGRKRKMLFFYFKAKIVLDFQCLNTKVINKRQR
jgi:hypothetical protein